MLDPKTHDELLTQLVDYYPESRIQNHGDKWEKTLSEWYKSFESFETQDFIKAIVLQRESSAKRFPSVRDLLGKVRTAKYDREMSEKQTEVRKRLSDERKLSVRGYQAQDCKGEAKEINREVFNVLRKGPKPQDWRLMAEKYKHFPCEEGGTMGAWFEGRALALEEFIRTRKELY